MSNPATKIAQHVDDHRLIQAKVACSMSNSFSSTFTSNTTTATTHHNQNSGGDVQRDHRAENEYFSVNRIDEQREQVPSKVKPEPPFSHFSTYFYFGRLISA